MAVGGVVLEEEDRVAILALEVLAVDDLAVDLDLVLLDRNLDMVAGLDRERLDRATLLVIADPDLSVAIGGPRYGSGAGGDAAGIGRNSVVGVGAGGA